jgi:hypothetical protein
LDAYITHSELPLPFWIKRDDQTPRDDRPAVHQLKARGSALPINHGVMNGTVNLQKVMSKDPNSHYFFKKTLPSKLIDFWKLHVSKMIWKEDTRAIVSHACTMEK